MWLHELPRRLLHRALLRDVVMHTTPWLFIVKCIAAVVLVILSDERVTKQPDTVTALFTALICLGPTVLLGTKAGMDVFYASMIGCGWGSLCTVIFHVPGDNVLHFDSYFLLPKVAGVNGTMVCQTMNPNCNAYFWFLLARVPLGVSLTMYTLFLIGRNDPGSTATGTCKVYCTPPANKPLRCRSLLCAVHTTPHADVAATHSPGQGLLAGQ